MANEPVFIDIDLPKDEKSPEDVEIKATLTSKEGVELNIDSSGFTKKGFKVNPKETENPKTI
jgi:hypothetical protein